jgi:hypothetical protein
VFHSAPDAHRIQWFAKRTGDSFSDQIWQTTDGSDDHWGLRCHGFQHDHRAIVLERGQHKQRTLLKPAFQTLSISESSVLTPWPLGQELCKLHTAGICWYNMPEKDNPHITAGPECIQCSNKHDLVLAW